MKKGIKLVVAVCLITVMMTAPVLAAPTMSTFTGWSYDGGAPRYYENGTIIKNHWLLYGNSCYYAGPDGYPLQDRVLSSEIMKQFPVDYINTNGKPVLYNSNIFNIINQNTMTNVLLYNTYGVTKAAEQMVAQQIMAANAAAAMQKAAEQAALQQALQQAAVQQTLQNNAAVAQAAAAQAAAAAAQAADAAKAANKAAGIK